MLGKYFFRGWEEGEMDKELDHKGPLGFLKYY